MADFDQELSKDRIIVRLIRLIIDLPGDQQEALLRQIEKNQLPDDNLGERDINRKPYENTIHFTIKDKSYTGVSQDISSGGMFIKTDEPFSVGQVMTLTIPFPKQHKQIKIPAEIVRSTPDGIGIEFMKKIEV